MSGAEGVDKVDRGEDGGMSWEVVDQDGTTWFAIRGEITEGARFAPLLARASADVAIDLSGVSRINSTGVREWIQFITKLEETALRLRLARCSVPIVQQLNMISNFTGHAMVISAYTPWFCETCDDEYTVLFDLERDPEELLSKSYPCPVCDSDEPMEFDDLPDHYFAFRKRLEG